MGPWLPSVFRGHDSSFQSEVWTAGPVWIHDFEEEKASSPFEVQERNVFRGQSLVSIAPWWRSKDLFSPSLQLTRRIFLERTQRARTGPQCPDASLA